MSTINSRLVLGEASCELNNVQYNDDWPPAWVSSGEGRNEAQTPISGNAIAYLFQFKVLFCLLHAGHALTHLHWIKRCSEHNNSNITDNNGNDNAHSQRQQQEQLVQHRSRSRSSPCCCIVKWKSTDIVAEKISFCAQWKSWSRKVKRALALKWKKNSNRQQAARSSSQQWQQCTWDKPVIILYTLHGNLLCICMRRIIDSRYANWTATTEAI